MARICQHSVGQRIQCLMLHTTSSWETHNARCCCYTKHPHPHPQPCPVLSADTPCDSSSLAVLPSHCSSCSTMVPNREPGMGKKRRGRLAVGLDALVAWSFDGIDRNFGGQRPSTPKKSQPQKCSDRNKLVGSGLRLSQRRRKGKKRGAASEGVCWPWCAVLCCAVLHHQVWRIP